MNRYFIRRILETIPLMLVISIFVFMFIHLIPGDPARTIAGLDAEESEVQAIREEYDLDKPLVIQYVKYMGKLFHGNMGQSMKSGTPVTELILTRMKTTLKLVFAGILWAPALGIFIGVISAIKRGKALDHACMFLAISGLSAPGFWLGLMGIQIFSVQLGWLPSGGLDSWKGMVLPSFTMGCSIMAVLARYSRSSMLDTPPAALIFTLGPMYFLNSSTSSFVAPPVPKPVEVLIKSAPALVTALHMAIFSSSVR